MESMLFYLGILQMKFIHLKLHFSFQFDYSCFRCSVSDVPCLWPTPCCSLVCFIQRNRFASLSLITSIFWQWAYDDHIICYKDYFHFQFLPTISLVTGPKLLRCWTFLMRNRVLWLQSVLQTSWDNIRWGFHRLYCDT